MLTTKNKKQKQKTKKNKKNQNKTKQKKKKIKKTSGEPDVAPRFSYEFILLFVLCLFSLSLVLYVIHYIQFVDRLVSHFQVLAMFLNFHLFALSHCSRFSTILPRNSGVSDITKINIGIFRY